MKFKKTLKVAVDSLIVVGFIAVLFVVAVMPQIGWTLNNVQTGSMVPVLNPGDMFICKKAPISEAAVGDIVAFYAPGVGKTPVVHRVWSIEKEGDEIKIRTKGDALGKPDSWVIGADAFIGKAYHRIPYVGLLSNYFKNKLGIVVGMVFLITLCVLVMIDIIKEPEKGRLRGRRRPKRSHMNAIFIIGSIVLLSWFIMTRSVIVQTVPLTPRTAPAGYYTEKLVENKGFLPLVLTFTSSGKLSDDAFILSSGEKRPVEISAEKGSVDLSSGAFFPLLPPGSIHLLFEWSPYSVPVVISLEIALIGTFLAFIWIKIPKKRRRTQL